MKFREKLSHFMWGRYGIDGLYYVLLVAYLVLWLIQSIVEPDIAKSLISIAGLAVLCFMIFRVFSKNIPARRRENEKFMRIWTKIRNFFVLQKNKIRDIKGYTYKKCPSCKATLRLPRKKGAHSVVCPKCKNRFEVKNIF